MNIKTMDKPVPSVGYQYIVIFMQSCSYSLMQFHLCTHELILLFHMENAYIYIHGHIVFKQIDMIYEHELITLMKSCSCIIFV